MADNTTLNQNSTEGDTIATDDIGGVKHQRVKVQFGADGSATDVSDSAGLPVAQQGTWTVDLGTTDAAALAAIETAVEGTLTVDGSGVTQPVSGTVTVQDGGGALTVDGTVAVTHAALTELAAAIDTEVQVDVVGSLPAGTNNIGDVDIASIAAGDNNIGNVDIASALPAGDNNIGNVDLASALPAGTNNIGDVDVLTLPSPISGPGNPVIDSYTHAAINLAAGNNQVIVSSAASKQIWVYGIGFVVNAAGSVSFQDEDDTAITGVMPFAANSGLAIPPSGNFAMPIWKLATDKDLEVDIVTSEVDGWIDYAVVSV